MDAIKDMTNSESGKWKDESLDQPDDAATNAATSLSVAVADPSPTVEIKVEHVSNGTVLDHTYKESKVDECSEGKSAVKSQDTISQQVTSEASRGGKEILKDHSESGGASEPFGHTSRLPTPLPTSDRDASTSDRRKSKAVTHHLNPLYGIPIQVRKVKGRFPALGSTLGNYFLLGVLGKGTFSSIHKCINLDYLRQGEATHRRLAAAKVELSSFAQSGVLLSEAMILEFLHKSLPSGTVPVYMGHFTSGEYSSLVMEYLPGEDMHKMRENVMTGSNSRRLHVKDAVYLTADVMLPLLRRMHEVGVVHRDVKPSNCVRSSKDGKDFCLVDFGLSKSMVVPEDSPLADPEHVWNGEEWLKPQNYSGKAYYRKQRERADFRGTSMYASLRVHQLKDYCPRDDIMSVLYVFCDLVSGGLPWMSHAANRDREMCRKLKEEVHGDNGDPDQTERLLMGDNYHVFQFRREQKAHAGHEKLPPLPEPLALSKDQKKVQLLREAFGHLLQLKFWEQPDYELVQNCIRGFLDEESSFPDTKMIEWAAPDFKSIRRRTSDTKRLPRWEVPGAIDPADTETFEETEESIMNEPDFLPDASDRRSRLPLQLLFRLEQMAHHMENLESTPTHLVLKDWFALTLPLLHDEWDAKRLEDGGHRTATDGFRRDFYQELLQQCLAWARAAGFFSQMDVFFHESLDGGPRKRRRIESDANMDMVTLSKAICGLKLAIQTEQAKRTAPPVRISFGLS